MEGQDLESFYDLDEHDVTGEEESNQHGPPIMMTQDCVAWNEGSNAGLPSHSSRRPQRNVQPGRKARKSPYFQQPTNHPPPSNSEIETIFSLLGPNGKQRVLPPEKHPMDKPKTNASFTADTFQAPLHKNQNASNRMRHSYPPSTKATISGNSRRRPDSFGVPVDRDRYGKKAKGPVLSQPDAPLVTQKSTISPVPPGQGPTNEPQKTPTTKQEVCGFADLLNQVETPSTTSSKESPSTGRQSSPPKSTGSAAESGDDNRANKNNPVNVSEKALHVEPKALSKDQAFLQAKRNKENMDRNTFNNQNLNQSAGVLRDLKKPIQTLSNFNANASTTRHPLHQQQQSHTGIQQQKQVQAAPTAGAPRKEKGRNTTEQAQTAGIFNEEDEFGDFELSEEDFAQVDTLVAATQMMDQEQIEHPPQQGSPTPSFPDIDFQALDAQIATQTQQQPNQTPSSARASTTVQAEHVASNVQRQAPTRMGGPDVCTSRGAVQPENAVSQGQRKQQQRPQKTVASESATKMDSPAAIDFEKNDPFGDFPDIDFDALDAQTQSNQQPQMQRTVTLETKTKTDSQKAIGFQDDFGEFPDVDFDALDAQIATQTQPQTQVKPNPVGSTHPPFIRNPRATSFNDETSYLSFTRYKVQRVEADTTSWQKMLFLKVWDSSMLDDFNERQALHKPSSMGQKPTDQLGNAKTEECSGVLVLLGSWFFVGAEEGDILHLCSLTGRFETGPSALPIILHTDPPPGSQYDDLVPIVHPDMMAIPTTVTDTLDCERRAVLKHRLGSTVSTSKALLLGTMRHSLFEVALKQNLTTLDEVRQQIQKIVRTEAERLVGCKMKSAEGQQELLKFWPQVKEFKRQHFATAENGHQLTTLKGMSGQPETEFGVAAVRGVEEEVTSPELGFKGNVDVLVEAITSPLRGMGPNKPKTKSLMSIELKTHHKANPKPAHFAQLAYYTAMLLSRHGHTASDTMTRNPQALDAVAASMLLYINNDTVNPIHVAPSLGDMKSLIQQRNTFCSQEKEASRPRGVELLYDDDKNVPKIVLSKEAPSTVLPTVQAPGQCSRCYAARECMLYAAADSSPPSPEKQNDVRKTHAELLKQYTGQLTLEELDYFRTWDRLIDLEADATQRSVAEAWLEKSEKRERRTSRCISSVVYKQEAPRTPDVDEASVAFAVFRRSDAASLRTPLSSLQLQKGSYITGSTDATTLEVSSLKRGSVKRPTAGTNTTPFRHQMKVFRGTVEDTQGKDEIVIRTSKDSIRRLDELLARFHASDENETELRFRLDCDDSYSQMGTLRRNIADLLTKDRDKAENTKGTPELRTLLLTKRFSRLRKLIIRLEPPVYSAAQIQDMFKPGAIAVPGCGQIELAAEFATMNGGQRDAIQKVASMQDYTLIQGFPGSGKSSTIVFVARMLAAQGKRVLITSYTHSAVDNCLLKLMEHNVAGRLDARRPPSMVRIGEKSSVHPGVQPLLASRLAAELEAAANPARCDDMGPPSAEALKHVLKEARIVGATALKVPKSPLLVGEHFDVVIVDEAGQITQPVLLGTLAAADSFILVGDHMQLPPLVSSEAALAGGMGESMLKRLAEAHPDAVQQLTVQYRMHAEICELSSHAIYNGTLQCPEEDKDKVKFLDLPGYPRALSFQASQWFKSLLNPYRPMMFANTDRMFASTEDSIHPLEQTASRQAGGNMVNKTEASLVIRLVSAFVDCGIRPSSIGVICPFNAQIRLLGESPQLQQLKKEGLEINTIDKYQGRDKDVIIVSFVRSNNKGKVGRLLEDKRRINVAITRAKKKMILLGSYSTLTKGSPTLKCILERVKKDRIEDLPPDAVPVSK